MFIIVFIIDVKYSKYVRVYIYSIHIHEDKVIMVVVTRAQQFLF